MSKLTIKESIGDINVEYTIVKNGAHSGSINAYIDGNPVIEDLNFTTAAELSSALHRAQVAVLSRTNTEALSRSAMETEGSQHFIKYAVDHLRRMSMGSR
jgi:hypothetical protein